MNKNTEVDSFLTVKELVNKNTSSIVNTVKSRLVQLILYWIHWVLSSREIKAKY